MTTPSITLSPHLAPAEAVPTRSAAWRVALNAFGSGVLWAAMIVTALMGLEVYLGVPRVFGIALMAFLGFAFVSAGEGIAILLWKALRFIFGRLHFAQGVRVLERVPATPVGRIAAAFIFIAGDILWPDSFFGKITLPVAGEIAIVLAGLSVMLIALARMPGRGLPAQVALVGLPILLILVFAGWLVDPGFDNYLPATPAVVEAATLDLQDPGLPGPYPVQSLTYGSGESRRRPEYGAEAGLTTPTVDGSQIFSYSGMVDAYLKWYWGFDFSQLPLNGMVWYPEGEGPFPLILIVHGNHAMSDYSDPGYAYLGEHLAGQGYIAASVDENFLNGLAFFDGEFGEMPLRAWLLLQHLRQWRTWNETPDSPFAGKVDLNSVALIGHSRGGEAAAWAEYLNEHTMDPITGVSKTSDFGFGIEGVVAISPSDNYAGPGGREPTVSGADYLLLSGGHDGDTFQTYGMQQYNRVRLNNNPDGFKALAYVYQGNHGQFNSVWGDSDRGLFNSWLLNRQPLLTESDQQQAAKALITSFLNASLRDEEAYRDVFRNAGATAEWLPAGIVVTQYQDEPFIRLDTNSGRVDLAVTEVAGATATALDATSAAVENLLLRDGEMEQGNRALRLSWNAGSQPAYDITLPEEAVAAWGLTPAHALSFALAGAPGEALPGEVWIELQTAGGETATLPLSEFAPLMPTLPARLVKADWLYGLNGFPDEMSPEEIVLQTYTLPLDLFQAANPAFQPEQLETIRFLFDGSEAGAIYLDEIGLEPPPVD